jgi:hypothetical protein
MSLRTTVVVGALAVLGLSIAVGVLTRKGRAFPVVAVPAAVVISGASTGLGLHAAETLAALGYIGRFLLPLIE